MHIYREVEDPSELRRLSDQLSARLREQLKFPMTKVVGYPSGHASARVHFANEHGQDVPWWSSELSQNGEAYVNLIGRADPQSKAFLMIDLQFNVPVKTFGRRHGGAFVQDIESGAIVLAHRGIVTRGMARVRKQALLQETSATTTMIETSQGGKPLLLVASLDSHQLVEEITDFAEEIRRAADAVVKEQEVAVLGAAKSGARTPPNSIDRRLKSYFDEFVGKRKLPRRDEVVVEVRHGRVVKQLRAMFGEGAKPLKSQQVDLAVLRRSTVLLFEVKTSASPTDLYTAIGQLFVHSLAVQDEFPRALVRRVLVIPDVPGIPFLDRMREGLGIEILVFRWKGSAGVEFDTAVLGDLQG